MIPDDAITRKEIIQGYIDAHEKYMKRKKAEEFADAMLAALDSDPGDETDRPLTCPTPGLPPREHLLISPGEDVSRVLRGHHAI